jgi:predicted esterase
VSKETSPAVHYALKAETPPRAHCHLLLAPHQRRHFLSVFSRACEEHLSHASVIPSAGILNCNYFVRSRLGSSAICIPTQLDHWNLNLNSDAKQPSAITMSQSLPASTDFISSLKPIIHLPPNNTPINVIIFLPGLGDTAGNFASFPRALNLPDALTITLNPPFPLPFPLGPGDHWSEDLQVDTSSGALDADSPLAKAMDLVAQDVIRKVLIDRFKFRPDHIHLFGFGQGGSVALGVPLHDSLSSISLGDVISIGGPLPLSTDLFGLGTPKNRTPVMLLSGAKSTLASADSSPLKRVKSSYEFVTYHQWKKADDSMPKSREEALPMMQFWAQKLKTRRGVPADAVEVS